MGRKTEDLLGKRFGYLVVIERVSNDRWNHPRWLCRCDCGTEAEVPAKNLRRPRSPTRSCGCRRREIIDLTGQRFGRLVCVDYELRDVPDKKRSNKQRAYWHCVCDCGRSTIVTATNLRKGNTTSCGCSRVLPDDAVAKRAIAYKYRRSALQRGQEMDLDDDVLADLLQQPCHYCGAGPSNLLRGSGNKPFPYNGLDRVDNGIGYLLDNVVPCCRQCNFAKGSMSYSDFLAWIDRLVAHNASTRLP